MDILKERENMFKDEVLWDYQRCNTLAMDNIAEYLVVNGNTPDLSVICRSLYWYISVYGKRPVSYVEDKFLEMMGVKPR